MATRPVSNPLALAVLACLWERPMYPYEITTTLRERGKEDSIRLNFGSLYSVIQQLVKKDLIEVERTEREGNRPERIVYAITPAGRQETDAWLRELIAQPVKEYPAFETGLSLLAMLPPAEAARLLRERLARLEQDVAEREALAAGDVVRQLPELFVVELTYRIAMLKAERDYVAQLAGRIERRELGGFGLWAQLHEQLAQGRSHQELAAELAPVFTAGDAAPTPEGAAPREGRRPAP
ncbi:PadR family transcriptional regulator [Cellulomonas sp. SG140]|uniref:PadR family transcriptional regulator n=1 Tax=Cellulomonas sp. SG140 TaxID=2976536 RepID=UPI0021E7E7F4|nr:PadR family transcriptional regulator [Cellulomonas sp. SG140]